jgi:photosystem II stability/assembly factor-like uncharacterized protein
MRCRSFARDRAPSSHKRRFRIVFLIAWCLTATSCREEPISPWQPVPTATDATFRDVFFLDDERGWIVGGGHGVDGGIVGETFDGGRTWKFRTGIVAHPRSRLFHLNAIHFWDERRGVIAADGGRLLRTVDGGQNWHSQMSAAGRVLSSLFFLDDGTGWAAGDQFVMRTTDAGESWQRVNIGEGSHDDFRARSIHFIDANRGVLVGHHGSIRRTADGGRSWERVAVSDDLGSTVLSAVEFVDADKGWIVGEDGTLLESIDGGRTWVSKEKISRADLNDLAFANSMSGWIVGYDPTTGVSTILRTRDGGATWTEETVVNGESLRALVFRDEAHGFAVGSRERRLPQRIFRYAPLPES